MAASNRLPWTPPDSRGSVFERLPWTPATANKELQPEGHPKQAVSPTGKVSPVSPVAILTAGNGTPHFPAAVSAASHCNISGMAGAAYKHSPLSADRPTKQMQTGPGYSSEYWTAPPESLHIASYRHFNTDIPEEALDNLLSMLLAEWSRPPETMLILAQVDFWLAKRLNN